MTAYGGLIAAMYAIGAGTLGLAAYQHQVSLGTLAVMLPMLPLTMQAGGVAGADVTLEQMLAAVPDLDDIVSRLSGPAPRPRAALIPAQRPPAQAQEAAAQAPAAPGLAAQGFAAQGSAAQGSAAQQLAARGPAAPGLAAQGVAASSIRLEGVSYQYRHGDRAVLDGLDLDLPACRSLGLVGLNGAGKTTLVTLLARLRDPTAGRLTADGTDLRDLDARAWQRQVAVVYQDFTRYPLTARENVAFCDLDGEIDAAALEQAAAQAGATSVIDGLASGWDTVCAPGYAGGADLSGGQWQRIALARALYSVARGAKVLVLDEPTAQLDIRAEAAFYDRFLALTAGVTTLVISHRFATVRRAERIAVLAEGRITELGSHDELLAAGGSYAQMFGLQASNFAAAGRPEPGPSTGRAQAGHG